jgi:hypothetical protein
MRKKKLSTVLEKSLRGIKDSDEFVAHIGNIAERYRREHAVGVGAKAQAMRQSLRVFQKHAAAMVEWLSQAQQETSVKPERDALSKIGAAIYGVPSRAFAESKHVQEWLSQAERAAVRCLNDSKLLRRNTQPAVAAIAAEAMRATFDYHKLKWSPTVTKTKQSDAVKVMCSIAKHAGDASMTPDVARQVLRSNAGKR